MVKVEAYEVPEGLYYSKDFEWIKIEGDKVRMGITDYAQKVADEKLFTLNCQALEQKSSKVNHTEHWNLLKQFQT